MLGESFETLLVEESAAREGQAPRVHVSLNRPEVRNAIDQQMVDELHEVCDALEREPRVLIISGCDSPSGPVFASGADIAQLRERGRADALRGINSNVFVRVAALPMPVIAALDGYVLGGGAELAYAADFRLATPAVKIGNPETGLGIMAAAGATWRLRELVGEAVAKEMLLAGRVLGAEEARALHLVTEVHESADLIAAAHALADRIGKQDPLAVRITKSVFHSPPEAHPVIDQIAQAVLFESEAKFERMDAFLERRGARR
ncbi:enoyl-CoA hydratase/isomerase family protein [Georgenia sp. EYE_87]|uniref:enoyl-CoA hydratase/isomerase family protein n=1 Tax=Georgenia sp. EYE_87 TaxID=2853448 RepID=UPI0020061F9F|nr:enoyl-CoA hydratase/isomerase family protein [Georgenia sp. EYE_87]MCK6210147.1 enoyl-CoA hydratase/isomerase family protein [Georgenia sp. EYE_87]